MMITAQQKFDKAIEALTEYVFQVENGSDNVRRMMKLSLVAEANKRHMESLVEASQISFPAISVIQIYLRDASAKSNVHLDDKTYEEMARAVWNMLCDRSGIAERMRGITKTWTKTPQEEPEDETTDCPIHGHIVVNGDCPRC